MTKIKLIDCTLRDGGYYTKWDFEPGLVEAYLQAMADARIDYVELGLRNFSKEGFFGPFAYTTDAYLKTLSLPPGIGVGVMVDAKTLLSAPLEDRAAVRALFQPEAMSPVQLVRVAAHFSEVDLCGDIVSELKSLGYVVGVNLMQASGKPSREVSRKIRLLLSADLTPDVIYFADSLGNMDSAEVKRLIGAIRAVWSGPIGIHAHNNRGLAVANSLFAMSEGVAWVDATVQGMGRGAGNAEMELLLTELGDESDYLPDAIYALAMEAFADLRASHRWGPSLLYYYSAIHNIHPTYAQELLSDDRYGTSEKVAIVRFLSKRSAASFSWDVYGAALSQHFMNSADHRGKWSAEKWCHGLPIVIVAAGPTFKRYIADIVNFARQRKARLLTVNTLNQVPVEAVDGVVTVNQNRIRFEATELHRLGVPVYAPISHLSEDCAEYLDGLDVFDYGLSCAPGAVELSENGCTLPYALSAIYALALALTGGASHVYLAGFDGYGAGDPRQQEMSESIELLRSKIDFETKVTAITPTNYPFRQGSLYAP
jgi:4-hydroxy 2-oxovalerate aldolase